MEKEENKLDSLSYKELNNFFDNPDNKKLFKNGYLIQKLPKNHSFIAFIKMEIRNDKCKEGLVFKKYGLKFHISLPEYDEELFTKGCDTVLNTLFEHGSETFKVIRSGLKMSDEVGQEGKDITVYADSEPGRTLDEWQELLQNITENLVKNNIPPGYRTPGTDKKPELPIQGSNYITYRYFDEKNNITKWPIPDPCKEINVKTTREQQDIPTLSRQVKDTKSIENQLKFE